MARIMSLFMKRVKKRATVDEFSELMIWFSPAMFVVFCVKQRQSSGETVRRWWQSSLLKPGGKAGWWTGGEKGRQASGCSSYTASVIKKWKIKMYMFIPFVLIINRVWIALCLTCRQESNIVFFMKCTKFSWCLKKTKKERKERKYITFQEKPDCSKKTRQNMKIKMRPTKQDSLKKSCKYPRQQTSWKS